VHLGERGLLRIIDAANKSEHLERLDVGILTDDGLMLIAERLAEKTFGSCHGISVGISFSIFDIKSITTCSSISVGGCMCLLLATATFNKLFAPVRPPRLLIIIQPGVWRIESPLRQSSE
jgi:hypothetical protein